MLSIVEILYNIPILVTSFILLTAGLLFYVSKRPTIELDHDLPLWEIFLFPFLVLVDCALFRWTGGLILDKVNISPRIFHIGILVLAFVAIAIDLPWALIGAYVAIALGLILLPITFVAAWLHGDVIRFKDVIDGIIAYLQVVGYAMIVFAILFGLPEKFKKRKKNGVS